MKKVTLIMKNFIHIKTSRNNIGRYCLMLFSLLFLLNSCSDKEDYTFNAEYVKELYDKTFPVKNIDPAQDWKTSSVVKLNVTVYEDELETYKIKVYDDSPFDSNNPANRLAMGEVENGKTIQLSFDCPIANDTLWVVCVDKANRRQAQIVSVADRNSAVDVTFGAAPENTRSYSDNVGYRINEISAPYSQSQINSMLFSAVEVESGKSIGEDITSKTNVFKLTQKGGNYNLLFNGTTQNTILIVTTEWVTPSWGAFVNGSNLTIVIANGGKLKGSLTINHSSNLYVLKGGSIEGGNIIINDASGKKLNYNGGNIDVNNFTIYGEGGVLYNFGTLKIKTYTSTDPGTTLTNMSQCEIGNIASTGTSNVENGCYMKFKNDCSFRNVIVANGAVLECGTFNKLTRRGNMVARIGKDAMIKCNGTYYPELKVYGPKNGKCLFKADNIASNIWIDKEVYFVDNVKFEISDFLSGSITLGIILRNGSTMTHFGQSNIVIPQGECTGDGNTPGGGDDTDDEKSLTYTYCYEDYYPTPGDYDFNDIVMDLSYSLTKVNNLVKSVEIPIQLTAVGASYALGAALQIIGIDKNNIESATVTNADLDGNLFSDQNTETRKNANYIIPIFKDAHHALTGQTENRYLYNTSKGHEGYADATPRRMIVNIVFKNAVADFGLENMDLFIARSLEGGYYEGQKDKTRIEVHLREFWDKRTADGVNFADNEAIAGNRTWAICIPEFKYPYENVPIYRVAGTETGSSIECAYPEFQQWASDRNTATQWYLSPNPGSIYR